MRNTIHITRNDETKKTFGKACAGQLFRFCDPFDPHNVYMKVAVPSDLILSDKHNRILTYVCVHLNTGVLYTNIDNDKIIAPLTDDYAIVIKAGT